MSARQIAIGVLIAVAVAAGFAVSAQWVRRPQVQWDLSLPWALSEFHTQNAQRFAAEVERVTEGRVRIVVHPGASLGIKGPGALRAIEDGVIAMAEMAGFQQVGAEPILGLEALPFLVDNHGQLATLYRFLRPEVEAAYARHDAKLLYLVPWPNQNLFSRGKEADLREMAGVKVRTLDANTSKLMTALGLTPVQLPSPDVVPALAAGAIDATLTSTTTAAAQKYWQFLDTTVRTNHNWACNMMVVGQTAWEKLSARDRAAIEALAARLEPEFWAISERDDQTQLTLLEAQGMTTLIPDDRAIADYRRAARPIWDDFLRRVPRAEAILSAYLTATGGAMPADDDRS